MSHYAATLPDRRMERSRSATTRAIGAHVADSIGSTSPFSMRKMVVAETFAASASCAREMPIAFRAGSSVLVSRGSNI